MNVLNPIFVSVFTADTFSCIKGRGIMGAFKAVRKCLEDIPNTQYCLKIDIKQFYPSIKHDILKKQLRRKFKDNDLLSLLDEIIDSAEGVPIGNYLSQYFANFYLTPFDHWIKEKLRVKHYCRYADDMVIFASTKEELHKLLAEMRTYLWENLKLTIKPNYQIFPIESRGVDFVGYVFFHKYIKLRKGIKKRMFKAISKRKDNSTISAYLAWIKHCSGKNLIKRVIYERTRKPASKKVVRFRDRTRPSSIGGGENSNVRAIW